MCPFDEATTVIGELPGEYVWTVPDGWQQGRGVFVLASHRSPVDWC